MELINAVDEHVVAAIAATIPVIAGVVGVWLLGRSSGLWEWLKDNEADRIIRTAAVWAMRNKVDDQLQQVTIEGIEEATEWAERLLRKRGVNVELDEIRERLIEQIYLLHAELHDLSGLPEEPRG